jgi:hypothetical protein
MEALASLDDVVEAFACGPLHVRVRACGALREKIAETLRLYDVRWSGALVIVDVVAERARSRALPATGAALQCSRMAVDVAGRSVYASTRSGASARAHPCGVRWNITVPDALIDAGALEEVEDLISLILTEGWRAAGWVPIHGAAVERNGNCAIVCAATGGGKSTLTASLVRAGWRTLGDDKLLLRVRDGKPELAALLHTFNLHPRTREWFPEVGSLERLPRYSAWTEKRKVRANRIWPGVGTLTARPTRLVLLERSDDHAEVRTRSLGRAEMLDTLLRQTVIPRDPQRATPVVGTIATTIAGLAGIRLEIGEGAYSDGNARAAIERAVGGA